MNSRVWIIIDGKRKKRMTALIVSRGAFRRILDFIVRLMNCGVVTMKGHFGEQRNYRLKLFWITCVLTATALSWLTCSNTWDDVVLPFSTAVFTMTLQSICVCVCVCVNSSLLLLLLVGAFLVATSPEREFILEIVRVDPLLLNKTWLNLH